MPDIKILLTSNIAIVFCIAFCFWLILWGILLYKAVGNNSIPWWLKWWVKVEWWQPEKFDVTKDIKISELTNVEKIRMNGISSMLFGGTLLTWLLSLLFCYFMVADKAHRVLFAILSLIFLFWLCSQIKRFTINKIIIEKNRTSLSNSETL